MALKVPKAFLRDFFSYLYYSIIPEYTLWDENCSIILEPICVFKIIDNNIVEWKLIDELINESFDISKIRDKINDGLNNSSGSELEQTLYPISKNIYELNDNPFFYPWERLKKFITSYLPGDPNICKDIDGICHFHPKEYARFHAQDRQVLKRCTRAINEYRNNPIIALIIAKGKPYDYIDESRKSKTQFIKHMMRDLSEVSLRAQIFYPQKKEKLLKVTLI